MVSMISGQLVVSRWHSLRRFILFNPCFVLAGVLALGLGLFWKPQRPHVQLGEDQSVEIVGWIARPPEILERSVYLEIQPLSTRRNEHALSVPGRLGVYVYAAHGQPGELFKPPLAYGEIVEFRGILEDPPHYAIPGVPDYRDYFWQQGVVSQVKLKSPLQIYRNGFHYGDWIGRLLFSYTARFEVFCNQQIRQDRLKLILSLFFGRKRVLEEFDKNTVKKLGIFHIFVVSGFHLSVIVFFFHFCFRCLGATGRFLTLGALWSYVMLVGVSPPVLRSGLMTTLFYLLLSCGLANQFLNGLGISGMAILAISPVSLYSPSFQFSYLCLCAIGLFVLPCTRQTRAWCAGFSDFFSDRVVVARDLACVRRRKVRYFLEEKLQFWARRPARLLLNGLGRVFSYFLGVASCSWYVQLLTLPLSLYYSNLWIWTQWFANVLFVPLFALFIPFCLVLYLAFWTPVAPLLAFVLGYYCDLLNWMVTTLEPYAWINYLPQPSLRELAIYFLLFFGFYYWKRVTRVLAFALPLMFFVTAHLPASRLSGKLQMTMLDVGQGESIHLRYPNGREALVDTGGFLSQPGVSSHFVGERLLARYLWEQRTNELAYVLLTHPHVDHIQGFSFIRDVFPIRTLFFHDDHPEYRGLPKKALKTGDYFRVAGVEHWVLHPGGLNPNLNYVENANNSSLVVLLRYRNFRALLTGDIDESVERQLLPRVPEVTILKAAHHGGRLSTSDDLLRVSKPKLVLISAGRKNVFGHPSSVTLERLQRFRVPALITSRAGSVRIETDGHRWRVFSYSTEDAKFRELH